MSAQQTWNMITAYMAENKQIAALEVELQQKMVDETINKNDLVKDQMLDCIYDDEPLGFKKDPMGSTKKIQAQDPLEEIDLGDGLIKRPTFISAKIDKDLRDRTIKLLKEYKDCFTWDYNEMPGLSREVIELKLPIRPDKKPVKQTPRRFAPQVLSKIKEEIERLLRNKFIRTAR